MKEYNPRIVLLPSRGADLATNYIYILYKHGHIVNFILWIEGRCLGHCVRLSWVLPDNYCIRIESNRKGFLDLKFCLPGSSHMILSRIKFRLKVLNGTVYTKNNYTTSAGHTVIRNVWHIYTYNMRICLTLLSDDHYLISQISSICINTVTKLILYIMITRE